jgi:hypothetical protein
MPTVLCREGAVQTSSRTFPRLLVFRFTAHEIVFTEPKPACDAILFGPSYDLPIVAAVLS